MKCELLGDEWKCCLETT